MSWPFHSVAEFFAMGHYAAYVWSAYGIMAVVLIGNILEPIWRRKDLIKKLKQL
ncbi:MAG: heme exporter protein CcmD [Gammaproteobacteria bacterium]|nr:heme exporter protein CcmD [Gammaproteobacteria bacterium]